MKEEKHTDILQENQMTIFVSIPKNTVKLEITAKLYDEEKDKTYKAISTLNLEDIIKARLHESEWEEENAVYCLTEKGEKIADNLLKDLAEENQECY